jgi:hypothetical protein
MKLKKYKREVEIVETDISLPVYLHYQDEACNDEYIKITEKYKITLENGYNHFSITVVASEDGFPIEEGFENSLTTEEEFNSHYRGAKVMLNKAVDGIAQL